MPATINLGGPEGLTVGLVESSVGVPSLALKRDTGAVGRAGGPVWEVSVLRVDHVDTTYFDGIGRAPGLEVGTTLDVELFPALAASASVWRDSATRAVFLLGILPDPHPIAGEVLWHAMGAIDRASGAFLGAEGDVHNALLHEVDPSLQSFAAMLAWFEESKAPGMPSKTGLRIRAKFRPHVHTWEETDPAVRSLALPDIPTDRLADYVQYGMAIEWASPPAHTTVVVRSSTGVSHAAAAGSGDHLANGCAKPGDVLSVDICDDSLGSCTNIASPITAPDRSWSCRSTDARSCGSSPRVSRTPRRRSR